MRTLNLLALLLISLPALAQDHAEDGDQHHDSLIHLGPVQVLGETGGSDILHTIPTVSNLHGEDLFKKSTNTIGETLRNELGVNSSQFGPGASRPVIRGLEGDRIRILQNGIGILDASGTSQDHAVPINPMTAESLEIVRGPISLLYGSSAVGGVVNIVNSRIHKQFDEGFLGEFDLKSESVNQGQIYSSKLDYGVNRLMFHLDGSYMKTENTDTPEGKIENSEIEQSAGAIGTTYISPANNYLGLSYSTFKTKYGVVTDPDVDIDLKQERIDLGGYYQLEGFVKAVRLKSAQTFYEHTELEGAEVGTEFDNNGNETRLEFIQNDIGNFHGVFGIQTQIFELSALGDEAFLPSTDLQSAAIFAFEEYDQTDWKLNAGARLEYTDLSTDGEGFFTSQQENNFTTGSLALGSLYSINDAVSTTLNLSYNERAPTYQELYSGGPHLAIGIFEQGDTSLKKEESFALEWSLRRKTPLFYAALTVFTQEFNNFISLNPTGATSGGFAVFDYDSNRARINGIEFEASHKIHGFYSFRFTTDYLYGQNLDTDRPLPRISPMRNGLELAYDNQIFATAIIFRHVAKQTRTAPTETSTDSYSTIDWNFDFTMTQSETSKFKLYLQANNLADIKARNHVSVIKDSLLLPGRNLVAGLRLLF